MSKEKNIDFIFGVMRMKLDHLYEASDALDQKISVAVGFLSVMVAGLASFFNERLMIDLCSFNTNFFTIGILSIFFSVFLNIISLATKKYHYPPYEDELYSDTSLNSDTNDLKNQTIADIKKSFKENHKIHEDKAKLFNYSLWFLIVGLFLILVDFL